MRRWLAVLMLVLLPAQFSWAVVGQYCGHETGVEARHLGHHSHAHAQADQPSDAASALADGAEADAPQAEGSSAAHADCEYCHLACCAVVSMALAYAMPAGLSARPLMDAGAVGRHAADQPERPQWAGSRTPV